SDPGAEMPALGAERSPGEAAGSEAGAGTPEAVLRSEGVSSEGAALGLPLVPEADAAGSADAGVRGPELGAGGVLWLSSALGLGWGERENATSASLARAWSATVSAPRRLRTKASVRTSASTRSASRSAASAVAVRRMEAPFSPRSSVSGGSHRAKVVDPLGEASSVTSSTSSPVSRLANAPGSLAVAEASRKTGEEPYLAQTRRRRRRIWATCEPKTPR